MQEKNRNQPTAAETALWMHLRGGINGYKFRRQHPIGMYIADFYCHKAKLVIEVDGSIHQLKAVRQNDEEKETSLTILGYSILRFINEEVMNERENVLSKISTALKSHIQKHTSNSGVKSPL